MLALCETDLLIWQTSAKFGMDIIGNERGLRALLKHELQPLAQELRAGGRAADASDLDHRLDPLKKLLSNDDAPASGGNTADAAASLQACTAELLTWLSGCRERLHAEAKAQRELDVRQQRQPLREQLIGGAARRDGGKFDYLEIGGGQGELTLRVCPDTGRVAFAGREITLSKVAKHFKVLLTLTDRNHPRPSTRDIYNQVWAHGEDENAVVTPNNVSVQIGKLRDALENKGLGDLAARIKRRQRTYQIDLTEDARI